MHRLIKIGIVVFLLENSVFDLSSAEPARKIISLAPSTTEILFSLNLDKEIIGVSTFCNYPEQALKKEKVGTFSSPDVEKIVSLKPDLIFSTGLEQDSVVAKLKKLRFNVYVSDPSDFEELFDSIREIGILTNRKKESRELIAHIKEKIQNIQKKVRLVPAEKRPKVFVEIWHDPLMTAGPGSFIDELITLAGGINIASRLPRPYSYISLEQVIKANPDFIFLGYMTPQETIAVTREGVWKQVNAVKNERVYGDINPDLILRQSPRLVTGLDKIHERLYPE